MAIACACWTPALAAVVVFAVGADTAVAQSRAPLGIVVSTSVGGGVVVEEIRPGSAAGVMGLRAGDRIVGVERRRVGDVAEFLRAVSRVRSGVIRIQAVRDTVVTEFWGPVVVKGGAHAENGAEDASRQCSKLCLDAESGVWRDCGCVIARQSVCTGCLVRLGHGGSPGSACLEAVTASAEGAADGPAVR